MNKIRRGYDIVECMMMFFFQCLQWAQTVKALYSGGGGGGGGILKRIWGGKSR